MVQRRRRSKKWISWLIILILLIAAVFVVYQVWDNYFNDKKEPETTEIDKKEETKQEENKVEPENITPEPEEKKENTQYEGENPNTSASLSGAITYAAASGNDLFIRLNIDQYLSGGNCSLRLVLEDDVVVYSETVNIVSSASTATCEGFNIPLSKIGSGNYKIYVNLESNGKTGTINGEVSI